MRTNGLRVLVVDDEPDTVDSSVNILNYLGFQAVGAYDAETAIKIAGIRPPHVVLLDRSLTNMDGCQLAKLLRQLPLMDTTTFICVSGSGTSEDRQRAQESGFDHQIPKPVDWQDLVELLEKVKPIVV